MMDHIIFQADGLADTDRLGARLAELLPEQIVVALDGTLGAGKTRLVQAIAAGCGIDRQDVVSPTFVLCQQYRGSRLLCHLDAYRLKDDDEFQELGPDEIFHTSSITLIEWANRVADSLPNSYLQVQIRVLGETSREFDLSIRGPGYPNLLEQLAAGIRS